MSKSLSINQIAVMAVCDALTSTYGRCRYNAISQYAEEDEVNELRNQGLIELDYVNYYGGTVLNMKLTTVGKCHLLNLSKQPIY